MIWFIPIGLVLLPKTDEIKLPNSCPSQFWPQILIPKSQEQTEKLYFFNLGVY